MEMTFETLFDSDNKLLLNFPSIEKPKNNLKLKSNIKLNILIQKKQIIMLNYHTILVLLIQ